MNRKAKVMVNKLKHFISRILPSSKRQVNESFNTLNREIDSKFNTLLHEINSIEESVNLLHRQIGTVVENISNLTKTELEKINKEQCLSFQALEKKQSNYSTNNVTLLTKEIEKRFVVLRNEILLTKRASKEAVWGEIFKDSIHGSSWLLQKTFYPGRWAVGYQFLYVLFRILSSNKPNCILELGLGQSTNLITQYVDYYKRTQHRVIEHDPDWIKYYKSEFLLSDQTELINLNIEQINFQEKYTLYHYVNFKENVSDRKYDLICIDAPFGGTNNVYSRIDVLDIIPENINESFVIVIDDVNRTGEQNTVELIKEKLEINHIKYYIGKYMGDKDTYVIVSENNKFISTL